MSKANGNNLEVLREEENLLRKLAMYLKIWKEDPLLYVLDCIGDVPTHQQAKILQELPRKRFLAVKSGHGIGKTRLFGWAVNWYLDCHGRLDGMTRVPITGAGGSQLEVTVFPEVDGACKRKMNFLSSEYDITTEKIMLKEARKTHFAVLRTARQENPDALQGFHECFFVIDEGSGVHDKIFDVARGAMGDPGSFGLMAGNPTKTSGYFFNLFDTNQKTWHCMSFSSYDTLHHKEYTYKYLDVWGDVCEMKVNGRQTKEWIDGIIDEYGEGSNYYRIRVLGEFANDGLDLVIEPEWLKDLRREEKIDNSSDKRIMGIDIARSGGDNCAICIRKGRVIEYLEEWSSADTMISLDRIKVRQEEWQCDEMIIDVIGMGGVVYDHLRRLEYPVYACDVRESPLEPNNAKCRGLRDSLWWLSRKFFKSHNPVAGQYVKDKMLKKMKKELSYPTYTIDKWLEIESKKDMLKRGLKSPNVADSVNLTFFRDRLLRKDSFYKKRVKKKRRKKRLNFKTA